MKHVLITGSTRGIGFGLAQRFIESGCKVTINGRSEVSINKAIESLKKRYPSAKVQGFVGNCAFRHEVEKLWDNAVKGLGKIDIWINNAGIDQERKYMWEIKSEEYKELIDINILGMVHGSTVAFKNMLEQGHGQIYNMEGFGSDGMIMEKLTLYGTSKSALRYFTRSLALEAMKTPILVGRLSPGMVLTDLLLKSLEGNSQEIERNKKIFNIMADTVETVSSFLSREILKNTKNNAHITWLRRWKIAWRFISSPFIKRELID